MVKQKKYTVSPLMFFYVVALILATVEIYNSIMFWQTSVNMVIWTVLMPGTLMTALAINQSWIMVELCLRISLLIKISGQVNQSRESLRQNVDSQQRTDKIIRCGRIIMCTVGIILILSVSTLCIVNQFTLDKDERTTFIWNLTDYCLPPLQLFSVIILTSSIVTLLIHLSKQAKLIQKSSHAEFHREIVNLTWILILFDLSYVCRGIYDYYLFSTLEYYKLAGAIVNIMCPAFFDFMPMTLILFFHYRNFRPHKPAHISETSTLDIDTQLAKDSSTDYLLREGSRNDHIDSESGIETLMQVHQTTTTTESMPGSIPG